MVLLAVLATAAGLWLRDGPIGQAQSAGVAVSNTGQTTSTAATLNSGDVRVQAFTTGSRTQGYTLIGIDLGIRYADGESLPTVRLRSGSRTGPVVTTLVAPSPAQVGDHVVAFLSIGVSLSPNTTYWVEAEGGGADVLLTAADAEDSGAWAGWSIADGHGQQDSGTATFTDVTSSLKMRVTALTLRDPVLVSNLRFLALPGGILSDGGGGIPAAVAQGFTTGSNTLGYVLSSVGWVFVIPSGSSLPTVTLRSGSPTGTVLATLAGPASFTRSTDGRLYDFTPPGAIALAANTTYWLVAEGGRGNIVETPSLAEDPGSAAGWDIDRSHFTRASGSTTFTRGLGGRVAMLQVNGTARTGQSLVSNVGQADATGVEPTTGQEVAQAFTTGTSARGYRLDRVDLRLTVASGDSVPAVTLRSGSAAGTVVATLTAPTTPTASNSAQNVAFLPLNPVALSANTTYWVVAEGGGGATFASTASSAEDSGAAAGWSIADTYESKANSTASFVAQSQALKLRVNATTPPNPQPAKGRPAIASPNEFAFRVPAELFVDFSGVKDDTGTRNIADAATYVWKRFDADGSTLEDANVGTEATYKLQDGDVGKTFKVEIRFEDDAGNAEGPLTSEASGVVMAAAVCDPPNYVGGAEQIWTGNLGIARHEATVGGAAEVYYGFGPGYGSLDTTSFTADSMYAIRQIDLDSGVLRFAIEGTTALAATERQQLALYVCDQAFPFHAASTPTPGDSWVPYTWSSSGLDWFFSAGRTLYLSRDQAVPTFESAIVDGTSLVITFSEAMGPAANLANGAFTVERTPAGGAEETVTLSSTAPSISGRTVTLTLASEVTSSDTNVKVTYTPPTSGTDNKLVDMFANEAAGFTDELVANPYGELVSNLGQAQHDKDVGLFENDVGQAFTTGSNPGGYLLTRVELQLKQGSPRPAIVRIRHGSVTGRVVATLSGPSALMTGSPSRTYTFTPQGRVTLLASTTYWVMGTNGGGWVTTFSDDEDEGAAAGFSIDNDLRFRAAGSSDAFNTKPVGPLKGVAVMMRVSGGPLTSLVSNVGQAEHTHQIALPREDVAQSFTTGSKADGYVLTYVQLRIHATSTTVPTVQLRRDSPTGPLVTELAGPAEMRAERGISSYIFTPPSPVTLSPSTTYWVVVINHHSGNVATTTSDSEDAGAVQGWSMGDELRTRDAGTNNTFLPILINHLKDVAAVMRIGGGPRNAAKGVPQLTTTSVYRVPAVLGVDLSNISDLDGTSNMADNATYNWQRFAADGTTLESDAIGTGSTYTLTDTPTRAS